MPDRLDLVQGAAAIGLLFDPALNPRQVQYLASTTSLPVFKFNGRLSTTRSAMQAFFARLASEALTRGPRRLPSDGETAPEEKRPAEAAPPPPPKRPPMETKVETAGPSLSAAPIAAPPPPPAKRPPPRRKPRRRHPIKR
jgi:hypothetical protein